MKKAALFLVLPLLIFGCDKDDTLHESDIIGTWQYIHIEAWQYVSGEKITIEEEDVRSWGNFFVFQDKGNGYRYVDEPNGEYDTRFRYFFRLFHFA